MKTTVKKILLVAIMFGTFIGYAKKTTEPTHTVDCKNVKVEFKSVKAGHTLTIKNDNAKTFFKQLIHKNGDFTKSFDLSALPDGNYKAELNKEFEIIEKPFTINNGIVAFSISANKTIYKPLIVNKEELLFIYKNNFNNEALNISIFYENKIIAKDIIKGEGKLKKVYKLSKDKKGNYKVIVKSNNREYIKNIII